MFSLSQFDVGVIKLQFNNYFQYFPQIGKKSSGEMKVYGCGQVNLKDQIKKCLVGENRFYHFFDNFFAWGESSIKKKSLGKNVSVAANDSVGALVDIDTGHIVGVHWGTLLKTMAKYNLPSLSISTSFLNEANYKFIIDNMGKQVR